MLTYHGRSVLSPQARSPAIGRGQFGRGGETIIHSPVDPLVILPAKPSHSRSRLHQALASRTAPGGGREKRPGSWPTVRARARRHALGRSCPSAANPPWASARPASSASASACNSPPFPIAFSHLAAKLARERHSAAGRVMFCSIKLIRQETSPKKNGPDGLPMVCCMSVTEQESPSTILFLTPFTHCE